MNRLKILEIKRRRYDEKQQKALANATNRSPDEHPITYILGEFFRILMRSNIQTEFVVNTVDKNKKTNMTSFAFTLRLESFCSI